MTVYQSLIIITVFTKYFKLIICKNAKKYCKMC